MVLVSSSGHVVAENDHISPTENQKTSKQQGLVNHNEEINWEKTTVSSRAGIGWLVDHEMLENERDMWDVWDLLELSI